MSAVSDILNRKGSKALTQILIFLVSFVLALLVGGVLLLLHGPPAGAGFVAAFKRTGTSGTAGKHGTSSILSIQSLPKMV